MIKVKGDEPLIKQVVLPNGDAAVADILAAFEMGNRKYIVCWFPLAQEAESKAVPFRFEEVNGFIRLFEIESETEFFAVHERFENMNTV
ncbi:DUF1292 domain-containing protein [Paenibacillus sp. HWE-109]|uniref:DUF1292 domain-containing protein n=1 Tax=Paenibacillus sp. HWE-109 TaxID=1306526 RepID=UPI001EDE759F|nr:DUF1292 domain-containing protein [Paenibacillus sp. HWE-109]UKS25046.1 DUF1292 domain-containing protein [Paenibacillus sp. HWE-109]UKS30176.1 DUF1292 domain-containing protein [Paenibacillus sp. HWE-109]